MSVLSSWPSFATNWPAGNAVEGAATLVAGAGVEPDCDGRNRGRNATARRKAITVIPGRARRARHGPRRPGLDGAEDDPAPALSAPGGRMASGKRGEVKGPPQNPVRVRLQKVQVKSGTPSPPMARMIKGERMENVQVGI